MTESPLFTSVPSEAEATTRVLRVPRCPRCGLDHGELVFHRESAPYRWVALCPEEADPLTVAVDGTGAESVIAFGMPKKGLS